MGFLTSPGSKEQAEVPLVRADHADTSVAPKLPRAPKNGLAPSLERERLQLYLFMLVCDAALLLGSFLAITHLYFPAPLNSRQTELGMLPAILMLPIFLTIALYNGTYARDSLTDANRAGQKVVVALLMAAALVNFFAFFAKVNAEFSRFIFTSSLFCAAILILIFRVAFVRWFISRWGCNSKNQLVIHAGGPDFVLPFAYHVQAAEHGLKPGVGDPAALDRLAKYLRNMDEVIVSCAECERMEWADTLRGTGRHGEVISEYSRKIGALGVIHHDSADVSSLLVSTGHLGVRSRVLKRIFDIGLSLGALVVLSPLLVLVAVAIKLQDGGPVFFRQRRMGRGNQFFDIYKFRSMREADANGDRSTAKDDDRVTAIGRLIRRSSIDELPQLINVLKGEMSLVGPRPHALGSKAGDKLFWQVDRKYWLRHGLRPGITGLAQIRGLRGATDHESDLSKRLSADLEYLQGWSLWRDIKIILATAKVLIHHRAF